MKKNICIICAAAGLTLLVTACASADLPTPSDSFAPTETVVTTETASPTEPMESADVVTPPVATATAAPMGFVLETVVEEMDFSQFIKSTKYLHYVDPAVLPENLQGQVYSKSGSVLTAYPKGGIAYDANGKEGLIVLVGEEPSFFVPHDFAPADFGEALHKAAALFYDDMYYPAYLPEGYSLSYHSLTEHDEFGTFNGAAGIVKYNTIIFSKPSEDENGKPTEISLLLRFMDKETAYDGGQNTKPVQFANVNGYKLLLHEKNVELMIGDVHYSFGSKEVTLHDMLNMVYSLTLVED